MKRATLKGKGIVDIISILWSRKWSLSWKIYNFSVFLGGHELWMKFLAQRCVLVIFRVCWEHCVVQTHKVDPPLECGYESSFFCFDAFFWWSHVLHRTSYDVGNGPTKLYFKHNVPILQQTECLENGRVQRDAFMHDDDDDCMALFIQSVRRCTCRCEERENR